MLHRLPTQPTHLLHYQKLLDIPERLQYGSPSIQNEALLDISKLKQVKLSA